MPDPAWMSGKPVDQGQPTQPAWMSGKPVDSPQPAPSEDPKDWQANLKPVTTHNGKPSVQRPDGAVWYGPEQGNTGKPGWFDANGDRAAYSDKSILPDWIDKGVRTFVRPFERTLTGAAQKVAALSGNKEGLANVNQAIAQDEADYQTHGYQGPGSGALEFAGAITQPIPGLNIASGPRVVGMLPKMIAGAKTGAKMGSVYSALQPVTNSEEVIPQTIQNASQGALLGGVLGGAIPPVIEGVSTLGSKLGDAGKYLIQKVIPGKYRPQGEKILTELEKCGVNAKPSEILSAAKVATPPESVAEAKAAMEALQGDLAANTEGTSFRGLKRLKQAADSGDQGAKTILERISKPGQTPLETAQTSGAVQAERARQIKNALWRSVDKEAGPGGVPLAKTFDAKEALRVEMEKSGDIPGLRSELDRLDRYFPQRDPDTGRMVAPMNPDKSFGQLKLNTVQRLNDIISSPAESADAKALQRAAGALKDALEGDMKDFAANSGNPKLWNGYQRANNFHRDVYAPTQGRQPFNVQNLFATDSAQNPAFASQLGTKLGAKSSGLDRGEAVGTLLGAKGRAAFAQSIVEDAFQKGIDPRTNVWIPGGSASSLAGRMDSLKAMLPAGPERMKVEGALSMLQHLAKASPENASALGERFAQTASMGSSMADKTMRALTWMRDGGVDLVFNNPKGKELLFKLSTTKPGSKAADGIVSKILDMVPGPAGILAGNSQSSVTPTFAKQNPDTNTIAKND